MRYWVSPAPKPNVWAKPSTPPTDKQGAAQPALGTGLHNVADPTRPPRLTETLRGGASRPLDDATNRRANIAAVAQDGDIPEGVSPIRAAAQTVKVAAETTAEIFWNGTIGGTKLPFNPGLRLVRDLGKDTAENLGDGIIEILASIYNPNARTSNQNARADYVRVVVGAGRFMKVLAEEMPETLRNIWKAGGEFNEQNWAAAQRMAVQNQDFVGGVLLPPLRKAAAFLGGLMIRFVGAPLALAAAALVTALAIPFEVARHTIFIALCGAWTAVSTAFFGVGTALSLAWTLATSLFYTVGTASVATLNRLGSVTQKVIGRSLGAAMNKAYVDKTVTDVDFNLYHDLITEIKRTLGNTSVSDMEVAEVEQSGDVNLYANTFTLFNSKTTSTRMPLAVFKVALGRGGRLHLSMTSNLQRNASNKPISKADLTEDLGATLASVIYTAESVKKQGT